MSMVVYRFQKSKYAQSREDILSGEGAKLVGGRWNLKGTAVIYTSESPALAHTEYLIHLNHLPPPSCHLVTLQVPENSILEISKDDLPSKWRSKTDFIATQQIGNEWWQANEYLLLKVPSAIIPMSYNYLINPCHVAINEVNIVNAEPFVFDERLILEQPTALMPSVITAMLSPIS